MKKLSNVEVLKYKRLIRKLRVKEECRNEKVQAREINSNK